MLKIKRVINEQYIEIADLQLVKSELFSLTWNWLNNLAVKGLN